ncbi:MAG: extracellular solute-binding protein [Aerococcaceae bacterium]|nr:extracellular solute-binding protein [Aerococcaceae bacterium]
MNIKKLAQKFVTFVSVAALATQVGAGVVFAEADKSETLVIYSNSVSGGRGDWLTEKAKEAGFNIQMVEIPGGELADRVIAEKNNAVADMVYGIGSLDANKLRDAGILTQFTPEWIDKVEPGLADKDNYYNPIFIQPLILVGTPDAKEMPKDWTELGEKFAGQYQLRGLTGGTPRAILASIIARYLDESGELGVSEEGWKVVESYIKGDNRLPEGQDYTARMLDPNEGIFYGQFWTSGAIKAQQENNIKWQIMSPEVGVPFVSEHAMILSASKKQELAQEFINWFGSAEVLEAYSAEFGSIPANKDAKVSDEIKEVLSQVKQQPLDWDVLGQHIDEWVEKVELEFVQ